MSFARAGSRVRLVAICLGLGMAIAGCAPGAATVQTVTETVPAPAVQGQADQQGGAPITVIDPGALERAADKSAGQPEEQPEQPPAGSPVSEGSESEAVAEAPDPMVGQGGSVEAAGQASAITGAPGDVAAQSAASESSAAAGTTTDSAERSARAVSRILSTACDQVIYRQNLTDALGKELPPELIRISDVANPDTGMTGRTKCYYGTSDIGTTKSVVLSLAGYQSEDGAASQMARTVAAEREAGAKVSTADVGGVEATVMIRDGGYAIAQRGAALVSVAITTGVISDGALAGAVTMLLDNALAHLN